MPVDANTHSLEATVSRFGANTCPMGWLRSRSAIWLSGRTSGNLGAWLVNGRARSSCARQQSPSRDGKHQRDQETSHRPLSLIVCECRSGMLYPSTVRVNKIHSWTSVLAKSFPSINGAADMMRKFLGICQAVALLPMRESSSLHEQA